MPEIIPSMRKLKQLIDEVLNTGIPGYPGMSASKWASVFGRGKDGRVLISRAIIGGVQNQERVPTIESLIMIGVLFQRAGADIGVFDLVGAACDGIYPLVMQKLGVESYEELPDWSFGEPEDAQLSDPPHAAVEAYSRLSFDDRKSVIASLLSKIQRDVEFDQMPTEFQIVQRLVKEAVAVRNIALLSERTKIPREWIEAILKGRINEVRAGADAGKLMRLAEIVPDLDGVRGRPQAFACLLQESQVPKFLREVETELDRRKHGKLAKL